MRVLCIGEFPEPSYPVKYDKSEFGDPPTIFDYDMVIMDLANLYRGSIPSFSKLKDSFERFFNSGGVCFVFATRVEEALDHEEQYSSYGWCPFISLFKIENFSGETVHCVFKPAKWLFDEIKFYWECFFSDHPKPITILAVNRSKDPISFMAKYRSGYCIFLPQTEEKKNAVEALVKNGLNMIPEREEKIEGEIEIPAWATEYATDSEIMLMKQKTEIERKLGKHNKFKALLWETGRRLEELVMDAFQELGIEVNKLPEGSHVDFEFNLTDDLIGVCEVKGLSGNADLQHLRQLLDYYVEQRDIEKRSVRGIFIVNHFKDLKPQERSDPATQGSLELAEKHNFSIMSTLKLHETLLKFWEGKLKKHDFLKEFKA